MRALGAALVIAWAVALAFTKTFTLAADLLTGTAIVAGAGVAIPRLWQVVPRAVPWAGAALWAGIAIAVAAFEFVMLVHGPRQRFPTISSVTNGLVFGHAWGRPIFGLLWLGMGGYLLRCALHS